MSDKKFSWEVDFEKKDDTAFTEQVAVDKDAPILSLPPEMGEHIMSFLTKKDLHTARKVNRTFAYWCSHEFCKKFSFPLFVMVPELPSIEREQEKFKVIYNIMRRLSTKDRASLAYTCAHMAYARANFRRDVLFGDK